MVLSDSVKSSNYVNTDDLNEDIVQLILLWLPVKTLLRFKCVCKSWYALISSSDFIRQHLLHKKNKVNHHHDHQLLVRLFDQAISKRVFYVLSFDFSSQVTNSERLPFTEMDAFRFGSEFLGSCNGLICLNIHSNPSYIAIWNPATKQIKALPKLPESYFKRPGGFTTSALGFGHDSRTDTYKVIMLSNFYFGSAAAYEYGSSVHMYGVGSDSWRAINSGTNISASFTYSVCDQAYTSKNERGVFSRLGRGYNGLNEAIISYDMIDDMMIATPLPHHNIIGTFFERKRCLSTLNECVAFINAPTPISDGHCDVWLLKEYGCKESWIKLYTVGPLLNACRTLGIQMNGDLLVENNQGQLISYSSSTKEGTVLPVAVGYQASIRVINYVESLISVH